MTQRRIRQKLLKAPDPAGQRCAIPFCGRLSMKAAGSGLAELHCEYHIARRARHGHFEVPTIKSADLQPYFVAATRWLQKAQSLGDPSTQYALFGITGLLNTAGRAPPAMDIKRWSPEDKAKAAFARLREAAIKPERIIAIHMGVTALLADDRWAPPGREYRIVQSAKAVHRLASGTHRHYEVPLHDGTIKPVDLHVYPRSQGQVLRVMGREIDEVCGMLAELAAAEIIGAVWTARGGKPHPSHAQGYEPEWRRKGREKHEAARRKAQRKVNGLDVADPYAALKWTLGRR